MTLEQAIEAADLEAFRSALAAIDPATWRDADGRALVHHLAAAVTSNGSIPLDRSDAHVALLQAALDAGLDPSCPDDAGWTPLHTAAMSGDAALCQILVTAGADRSATNGLHAIPAHLAMFYAGTDAARVLRLDPPSLREAAALGDLDALAAALADPAIAAQRLDFVRPTPGFPEWERTSTAQELRDEALSWAARHGQIDALQALVDAGANVDANAYRGTALLWATYSAQLDAIRWLVEAGANPSLPHDFGGADHGNQATPMHLAAQFDSLETVQLLVELGADWTLRDGNWQGTPREWAENCGAVETEMWMHAQGAP